MIRYRFGTYTYAWRGLLLARRIRPDIHWYITNEGGAWDVVEGEPIG